MSGYTVYVTPDALREIRELPGNMRQRVKRAIDGFVHDPRPSNGKVLDVPDVELEVWRLRLDKWRILYAIGESDRTVDILAVRKRPPYDYGDLDKLLAGME